MHTHTHTTTAKTNPTPRHRRRCPSSHLRMHTHTHTCVKEGTRETDVWLACSPAPAVCAPPIGFSNFPTSESSATALFAIPSLPVIHKVTSRLLLVTKMPYRTDRNWRCIASMSSKPSNPATATPTVCHALAHMPPPIHTRALRPTPLLVIVAVIRAHVCVCIHTHV